MNDLWCKYDLLKKKKELITILNNNKDDIKVRHTLDIIKNICLKRESKIISIQELLIKDYYFYKDYEFWQSKIEELAKLKIKYIDSKINSNMDYSNIGYMDYIDDFYKNCTNNEIYNAYKYIYEKNKKNIKAFDLNDSLYAGETIYLEYYNKMYIMFPEVQKFEDLVLICHEFGHAIENTINYKYSLLNDNYVHAELISTFMEILSTEYLTNKYFHQDGAIYSAEKIANRIMWNKDTYDEMNYLKDIDDTDIEEFIRTLNRLIIYFGDYGCNYLMDLQPSASYVYSTGLIVACNLFNIYKENKDKALELVMKIIMLSDKLSPKEYFNELNKLNLTDVKQVKKYRDYVNKRVRKI